MTDHELQQLARTVLGMLDPLIQAGAAFTSAAENGPPGKCSQAWCPVCAVAAIAAGEQHPLAAVVAEHGSALVALIRAVAHQDHPGPPDDETRVDDVEPAPAHAPSAYQPIPVTIHD